MPLALHRLGVTASREPLCLAADVALRWDRAGCRRRPPLTAKVRGRRQPLTAKVRGRHPPLTAWHRVALARVASERWRQAMTGYYPPPGTPAGEFGPRGASDDQLWALLAYLLAFVASIVAPLVIYLVKMNESRYVRYHAAQALNMGITLVIYSFVFTVVGIVLTIFTHGIALIVLVPLFIAVAIAHLVYLILAAVGANRGEVYRVPLVLSFPMVR
jgi:uncharacterized Tic20 family protein